MRTKIDEHREELRIVLELVKNETKERKQLKRFPTRFSPSILSDLRGRRIDNHSIGHSIRQIHDFYGWMAKEGSTRGHCAGALYRTQNYLLIDRNNRDGSKGPNRNIHIEHTLPVNVLERALAANLQQFDTATELHSFLISKSICTAFSHYEQQWLSPAGVPNNTNSAFDPEGRQIHKYPFRRYMPLVNYAARQQSEFNIFNIVTGAEIDLENYSFDDHLDTLKSASDLVPGIGEHSVYDLELFDAPNI